jgi:hypothetical protein
MSAAYQGVNRKQPSVRFTKKGRKNETFMKKFLLGLLAVSAMLLPMSQSAQARWVYYHRWYPYHHIYVHRHYWHPGYWYAGCWYPGYWGWAPAPVVVVAPY